MALITPDLLGFYCRTAKWVIPMLVTGIFAYMFVLTYIQARVERQWLDRLQGDNDARGKRTPIALPNAEIAFAEKKMPAAPPVSASTLLARRGLTISDETIVPEHVGRSVGLLISQKSRAS